MPPHPHPRLQVLSHPLIQHKLSMMRDRATALGAFRRLAREIALLMGYEVTRPLTLRAARVQTPLAETATPVVAEPMPAIVPVLRAGLGMADGLVELIPDAPVGHIGLARDEITHRPSEYAVRLPPADGRLFILVDPMIATGHSAAHAIAVLKRHGVPGGRIAFMALLAAPEGLREMAESHPDVPVYVAALDERLDEHAYIVPGLGDAGDRLFGT